MISSPNLSPTFLYKISSLEDWQSSKDRPTLKLNAMDTAFIHLATKEQLARILEKFWANARDAVILQLDVSKLQGRLALERNPGGATEYYHLYDGAIPIEAVVKVLNRTTLP
jgi:uncharacterized protein (DUF952 family)